MSPLIYSYLVENLGKPEAGTFMKALAGITPRACPGPRFTGSSPSRPSSWSWCWLHEDAQGGPQIRRGGGDLGDVPPPAQNPTVWLSSAASSPTWAPSRERPTGSRSSWPTTTASTHTTGAKAVSWFWGLLTAGCFIGMLLLKVFDSRKVLIGFSTAALLCLSAALFGPASVSVVAFR